MQAGSVTMTVQDNQGLPPQTFTFSGMKANADFERIGIIAIAGSGETIKSVTVQSAGFEEVKQVEFSSGPSGPSAAVPELDPGSLAGAVTLMIGGVVVLRGRRRD